DGIAGVLQLVEVADDLVQADALDLGHERDSGSRGERPSRSPVYGAIRPGASLPKLPRVSAGPASSVFILGIISRRTDIRTRPLRSIAKPATPCLLTVCPIRGGRARKMGYANPAIPQRPDR